MGLPLPSPESLRALFQLNKKADVERYASQLTITDEELCDLISGCGELGYTHDVQFKEFSPAHLEVTAESFRQAARSNDDGQRAKLFNKIRAGFEERKVAAAHMFYNGEGLWHLFYFSCKETDEEENNHWAHGTHVHFVNYLWPGIDPSNFWENFGENRQIRVAGPCHIRFQRTKGQ